MFVADTGTTDNVIAGNLIGAAGVPNGSGIIVTANAVRTQILANNIQANTGIGIAVIGSGTVNNPIIDNVIDGNGGPGIDLGANGVTANDSGDADTGPNNQQNFPVLGNVVIGSNSVTLIATLNSQANQSFNVTFYRSDRCDASGYGEGQVELGTATIFTAANGNGNVPVMYPVPNSQTQPSWGTAIARSASGDTSEFGRCVGISDSIFADNFE